MPSNRTVRPTSASTIEDREHQLAQQPASHTDNPGVPEPSPQINAVAVRFSAENTPRGWKALDTAGVPMHVRQVEDDLVYILSSFHWSKVQDALQQAEIPYRYKTAPAGFSKPVLEEPNTWEAGRPARDRARTER